MLVIFLLGFFLDFIEIAIVVVPIVAPILLMNPEANVTAVWLGVMIGINIQTSFLTPPFGFALFYLRGVADRSVKTLNMYKGVIPFILLQLSSLVIVGYNPWMVNYLPSRVSLLSENAPPPRNPRLQHCVDEHLLTAVPQQRDRILGLVAELRTATGENLLPRDRARDLARALDGIEASFAGIEEFRNARLAIAAASPTYKPLHVEVAALRREEERLNRRIALLERQARAIRGNDDDAVSGRAEIDTRIAAFRDEITALRAGTPERWDDEHRIFLDLVREEANTRRAFRAAAEQSYLVVRDVVAELDAADAIADFIPQVDALVGEVGTANPDELGERIREVERALGEVPGGDTLRSALSDLRGALSGRRASAEQALALAPVAADVARSEAAWRAAAALQALPAVSALEAEARMTLGLREQPRFERDTALALARCLSVHRDISLNF
jgi:hypothetical protein